MNEINLGREFSNQKICIRVNDVDDVARLAVYLHDLLFEDVSLIKSRLYHGVYNAWFERGKELSIGKVNNQIELLSDGLLASLGYEAVECDEFIKNIKRW